MGEIASLWGYAEDNEMDQLGEKLLCTTLELEKLKSETIEEMKKNKEYVNQLIALLKCAIQERDEAKTQLGNLINRTLMPNSSLTESSNSLSNCSSPVSSSNNGPLIIDQGSLIIDCLVKGRVLPEKGMFLQAVLQAGPLLQTLLLAGPLPTWRNPPRLQPFQIPPVSMAQRPAALRHIVSSQHSYGNVGNVVSGSCFNGGSMVAPPVDGDNGCLRFAKRQRFC